MTPDEFSKLAELAPDGLLMVTSEGQIVAANRSAIELLRPLTPSCVGQTLAELCSGPAEETADFLRLCRRSSGEIVGALKLPGNLRTRLFGRLLQRATPKRECRLLLRIPDEDTHHNRFQILNEKINQLSHEIVRRQTAEAEIRRQRDLAAFGRDVGLALAAEEELDHMLQQCTELMVQHLGAAFARIWVLDKTADVLELRASAGIYTHLNGGHRRIPVGQYKIGQIAASQTPHLTNAVIGDPCVHDQEWAKRERMIGFAGFPLIVDGRTLGVMGMFARHAFTSDVLDALGPIASSIALGITRKTVASELKRAVRKLKGADKRKDEFLAMLAHELRNPLAPIRSGLELLELQGGESDTLSLMHEQVQHLTRLVDDLLDVSRIMRGRIDLRLSKVLLNDVIDHSVRTVHSIVTRHDHTLLVKKCSQPVWLEADAVRLGQIITNLLNNSAKYTPDGGRIELESQVEDDSVVITVRDNGVGIDASFLPEIFELFSQAERGLDRAEGGLGIGLTLVQRMVELHGGSIQVFSDGVGQGSTFTLRLPMIEAPSSGPETILPSDVKVAVEHSILVVDDSRGSARILRRLLEAIGLRHIELAHDGQQALQCAQHLLPDVIFLDIGLPGLTGFEVAERLRADPRFESTHLIALTGYGTAEDRRKSHAAGFDDHLVKPVSLAQLKSVLSKTADRML